MLRLNLEVLRKPVNTDVGIAAHAIAREPPCHPCIHSEISQVSKLQDKHNASFDNPICPAGACLRPGAKVRKKQDYPPENRHKFTRISVLPAGVSDGTAEPIRKITVGHIRRANAYNRIGKYHRIARTHIRTVGTRSPASGNGPSPPKKPEPPPVSAPPHFQTVTAPALPPRPIKSLRRLGNVRDFSLLCK